MKLYKKVEKPKKLEKIDFDSTIKMIARKHNIDLSKIDTSRPDLSTEQKQKAWDRIWGEKKNKEFEVFERKFQENNRKRLFNSALISDIDDLKQTFNDFKVINNKQKVELLGAKKIAYRIINGEVGNFTFSGNAGSGKTMLAISILNQVMLSNKSLSCYFASFAMMAQMGKDSINDEGIKRDLIRTEKCIKACDILVLDDLGSESAFKSNNQYGDNEASNYTQKILFRIADYRKSKVNIVTTNNSSKELQEIYNPKIYSRLIAKKLGNAIRFDSEDMRNI